MAKAKVWLCFPKSKDEDYTDSVCLLFKPKRKRHFVRAEFLISAHRLSDCAPYDWYMLSEKKPGGRKTLVRIGKDPSDDSRMVSLYRHLAGAQAGWHVDHKNRCPQDNRDDNLRLCTRKQNMRNTLISKRRHSKYKGVTRNVGATRPWVAYCQIDGKTCRIGSFYTEEQAAYAYNQFVKERFGEFAYLNPIPPLDYDPSWTGNLKYFRKLKRRYPDEPNPWDFPR